MALALPHQASAEEPTGSAELVVRGGYESPQYSPDGSQLLLVSDRMQTLTLIELSSKRSTQVASERGAGTAARFLSDGSVAYQAKRAGKIRTLSRDVNGQRIEIPSTEKLAFAHKGRVYLRTGKGPILLATGDTFFAPTISPDKSKIAFCGLASGIYVHDIGSGSILRVGQGTYPSWSRDSKKLVYEWTVDDGHQIVGSDLWLWDSRSGSRPLTQSDTMLERHPSFSPDGKGIVFDDSVGGIYRLGLGAKQ